MPQIVEKPEGIRSLSQAEMMCCYSFDRHNKSTQSSVIREDDFRDIRTQECLKRVVLMWLVQKSCGKLFYKMYLASDFLIDDSMLNPLIRRWYCSVVISVSSSFDRGQWNLPLDILL